jgi:hypothetical protein
MNGLKIGYSQHEPGIDEVSMLRADLLTLWII